MKTTLGGVLALVCLAACGDNSKECGEGTSDTNGDNICEPDGTTDLICGDGTVLDPLTLECVPDPSVCGNGTVLINGVCQDPTGDLTIDFEEGPEPNGFEIDATPAGLLSIKEPGEGLVVHGCITPLDNNSPDLDVYEFDVTGPTLLHIAADGVQGLAAGFLMLGDDPILGNWLRLGINLSTDTSKREVFLPVAGHYQIVMTDTRTLLPLTQNGEGFPAAGNPDGTSCYYVTITQRVLPTPEVLDLTTGITGTIGEDLKFFTGAFPTGFTGLVAVIDPEDLDGDGQPDLDALGNPIDSRAASSLVIVNNGVLRQYNEAGATSANGPGRPADGPISRALFGGIEAGDSPLVILDYAWNYAIGPAEFAIAVDVNTTSQALSTTGATVAATVKGTSFITAGESEFDNINLFHFDVAATGEITAMDIAFSEPMQGSLIDQDGSFASPFTGLLTVSGNQPTIHTFEAYKGLLRSLTPGRYYFFLFAPRNAVGDPFTVQSTITPLTPTAITLDTPTAQTAFNSVRSNPFTYNAGTEPWQTFNVSTTGGNGSLAVDFFDPAVVVPQTPGFAFGRLDGLITQFNQATPTTRQGDGTPLRSVTFDDDGSTPVHQILRNPLATLPPATTNFLIKVNPTLASPTGTFGMSFSTRVYDDFGGPAIAGGQTKSDSATLTAGSEERYYFEALAGHTAQITIAPDGAQPTLDLELVLLDPDESDRLVINANGTNANEVTTITMNLSGFTAFKVRGANGTTTGAFTVSVTVTARAYTAAQTATTFEDACSGPGATLVALAEDSTGNPANDEGLSAPIAAPSGFELHGDAVTNFVVSSNGFLSFDTTITEARFDSFSLFDASATGVVHVAPHWDDLADVIVCTKLSAGARIVQWEGFDFVSFPGNVQFQAILDPSGTIEFVYGPLHLTDGSSATVGTQDLVGVDVLELGVDQPIEVPQSSIKLTPN
ncbi:MAG: hypothetical protein H0V17_28615 [Deltaproteobacteria bacterium]|nr:hypothetical protein [Deltaproteobacteria bacterium]